ncbi:MAG: hypothetical protein ACOYNZ_14750 [Rhodoferax sp.]
MPAIEAIAVAGAAAAAVTAPAPWTVAANGMKRIAATGKRTKIAMFDLLAIGFQ